jgi:hypothetical protein
MKTIKLSNSEQIAVVDDIDYELVSGFTWYLKSNGHGTFYVCTSKRTEYGIRTIRLHRLIMNPKKNEDIHHKNYNPLDNIRSNLERFDHKYHGYEFKGDENVRM